jgi:hypothetical protein
VSTSSMTTLSTFPPWSSRRRDRARRLSDSHRRPRNRVSDAKTASWSTSRSQ